MSVEEVESGVAQLSPEELARFSRWFEEFTNAAEWEERRKVVAEIRISRAEMAQRHGIQPDSVDVIRETRDNPRA